MPKPPDVHLSRFDPAHPEVWIAAHTTVTTAPLVPEVRLHLASADLLLAREEHLKRAALHDPYWAFAWPGGQAMARWLLDDPEIVRGRRVLEVGSGSALVAIAAALCGATSVEAADIDPTAAVVARMNAALNGVSLEATARDPVGDETDAEVVLVADTTYERTLAIRVAEWVLGLGRQGVRAYIADPDRGYLPIARLRTLAFVEAPADGEVDGSRTVRTRISGT